MVDGLGNVLAVGPNVLDGSGTGKTWDSTEGLDASEALFTGIGDDVIPWFASLGGNGIMRLFFFCSCSCFGVPKDDTGKAFVFSDSVGATAENKGGKVVLFCESVGFFDFGFIFDINDIFSGTTKTHGSKLRQWYVFANIHGLIITFLGKKESVDGIIRQA